MSIHSLMSALSQGFNATQVIGWLSSNSKKFAKHIKSAKSQGYNDDQILSYLTKGQHASHGERNEMLSGNTEAEKGARIFNQGTDWSKLAKGVGTAASLVGGAYGLAKGIPAVIQGAKGLLQRSGGTNGPSPGPAPMSNAPIQPPSIPSTGGNQPVTIPSGAQPNIIPNTTQPTSQLTPPQQTQQPPIDTSAVIQQMGIAPQIENLHKAGNTPEQISAALETTMKPHQKQWLQGQIKEGKAASLPEMVKGYVEQIPAKEEENVTRSPKFDEKVGNEAPKKLDKGSFVATPVGSGEIESIRNKEALVKDESGKLHKVKIDELIESPLPEKELADLYDELIHGVEKHTGEQVSRNVNWAGYDPNVNELAYIPHDGSLYVYKDISPEDVEELTNILSTRKSTGANFIGAWSAGSKSPIGAKMFQLIQKLQKQAGGKGKEYERKYQKVYDYLEPAVKAAKKKKKEQK